VQFLTLFTPAEPPKGPPDQAHMAKMLQLIEDMSRSGVLVATGGIGSRNTGMKVTRRKGEFTVEEGPVAGSSLMPAGGFAILEVSSREELVRHIKAFQDVAGDGSNEAIQLMGGPPPQP